MSNNDDTQRTDKIQKGYQGENQNDWVVGNKKISKTKTTWEIQKSDPQFKAYDSEETAVYANNKGTNLKTTVTPGGSRIDIDDTKDKERLLVRHPTGTYAEMHHDGKMQIKTTNDMLVMADGNCNLKITGACNIHVAGNEINIRVDGSADIQTDNMTVTTKNVKWKASGDFEIDASGDMTLKGSNIHLNP